MLWSLDQDDFTGLYCQQGAFPFTRRVRDILVSSNKTIEEGFSYSTKLRSKQTSKFIPIHRRTSQKYRSSLTSTLRSTAASVCVRSSVILYLFSIISFKILTRWEIKCRYISYTFIRLINVKIVYSTIKIAKSDKFNNVVFSSVNVNVHIHFRNHFHWHYSDDHLMATLDYMGTYYTSICSKQNNNEI